MQVLVTVIVKRMFRIRNSDRSTRRTPAAIVLAPPAFEGGFCEIPGASRSSFVNAGKPERSNDRRIGLALMSNPRGVTGVSGNSMGKKGSLPQHYLPPPKDLGHQRNGKVNVAPMSCSMCVFHASLRVSFGKESHRTVEAPRSS